MTVDAFQWNGGTLSAYVFPGWVSATAPQTPGDGTLNMKTPRGTFRASIGDWCVHYATGHIEIMSNTSFTSLYV